MNKCKYIIIACFSLFVMVGCSSNGGYDMKTINNYNNTEIQIDNTTQVIESNKILSNYEKDKLVEFIQLLSQSTYESDAEMLKQNIDEGIYSINYFDDGRDVSRVVFVEKEAIRDDLILVSSQSKKAGINLMSFVRILPNEVVDIQKSDFLNEFTFDIDWNLKDEAKMQERIWDIKDKLRDLILTNNTYIPQIFVLKDDYFAFSNSSIYTWTYEDFAKYGFEDSYDENNPVESFTGTWVIFEKKDENFIIHAFVKIQ